MDNQQERLKCLLFWLGGIIDGEGCISLTVRKDKKFSFTPRIHITNTDELLIQTCSEILSSIGIGHHIQKTNGRKKEHRARFDITINGMKRCLKALETLKYVLVIKKPQAEVLANYCKTRLAKPKNAPIDEEDLQLVETLRTINATGKNIFKILRDYTPDSDIDSDEDIVQSLSES